MSKSGRRDCSSGAPSAIRRRLGSKRCKPTGRHYRRGLTSERQPNHGRVLLARGIEARLPRRRRFSAGHMRNWLIVVSGLHGDFINLMEQHSWGDSSVTRRQCGALDCCVENGLPLHETCGRNVELGIAGESKINASPTGLQLRSGLSTLPLRA